VLPPLLGAGSLRRRRFEQTVAIRAAPVLFQIMADEAARPRQADAQTRAATAERDFQSAGSHRDGSQSIQAEIQPDERHETEPSDEI
jgi:hypothetical protein